MRQLWGFDECAVYNLPLQGSSAPSTPATRSSSAATGNNKEGKKKEGNNKGKEGKGTECQLHRVSAGVKGETIMGL